jgi:hypothetical protein
VKKTHKEVVINAETLETRVAVIEDGKLEDNIERIPRSARRQHLQGSAQSGGWTQSRIRGHRLRESAFLHYWDIVPNFDSGVEIVERPNRRRDHTSREGYSPPLFAGRGNHRASNQRAHQY